MQLFAGQAAVDEEAEGEALQEQTAVIAIADSEGHATLETRSRWAFDISDDRLALGPDDEGDATAKHEHPNVSIGIGIEECLVETGVKA